MACKVRRTIDQLIEKSECGIICDQLGNLTEAVSLFCQSAAVAQRWHDIFCSEHLDVILSPVAPYTAPPHDTYGIAPYTSMWNMVDYPAISIPFGGAAALEISYNVPIHLKGFYAGYEAKAFEGGIGTIQIVAPTNMDEKRLAAATIIDNVLNSKQGLAC